MQLLFFSINISNCLALCLKRHHSGRTKFGGKRNPKLSSQTPGYCSQVLTKTSKNRTEHQCSIKKVTPVLLLDSCLA